MDPARGWPPALPLGGWAAVGLYRPPRTCTCAWWFLKQDASQTQPRQHRGGEGGRVADDDAVAALVAATRSGPTSLIPLIELAAAYSEAGQEQSARRTAAAILQVAPQFTVSQWIALSPYEDESYQLREVEALLAAGLPR